MATLTPSPCALWVLILTISLTLTGCMGADSTETYTVGSILVEPFLMKRAEVPMGADSEYEGFIPDLMKELGKLVGVNFKITLQPDGKFGSKKDNGSWDGLMGSLTRNDIDVAAGPLTITVVRNRVINFSKRFLSTGLVIVISGSTQDRAAMSSVGFIFKPFTPVAWGLLIVALIMVVVFAVIVHRLHPREETGDLVSVSTQLTTCSSGGAYSGCVLRTTMVLFVVLTLVLYTVGMVSLRPAQIDHGPQQSNHKNAYIHDIVNSGQYKIAVVRGGATNYFFKISNVPLYEKMSHTLTYVENISAGFDLVLKDPGYAFITDKALVEYYISRKPYCALNVVGGSLNTNGYGLGLPLGSKLREPTDMAILHMQESGVLDMLYNKWWFSRAQCGKPPAAQGMKRFVPSSPGIDSTTLGGVLIILLIGLLLAVGVAAVERRLRWRANRSADGTNRKGY